MMSASNASSVNNSSNLHNNSTTMQAAGSQSPMPRSNSVASPIHGGEIVTSSAMRHSMEADREARRERRARIERQVQAALFEQRSQHTNAVSGLKTQLLELKHQDEIAALKHQARARESTLEQELANLQRQLEEERNRRNAAEVSARRAVDGQRTEADRREVAEAALNNELARRNAEANDSEELKRRIEQLQRAVQAAKAANDSMIRDNRERSANELDKKTAEDAAKEAEVEALRKQLAEEKAQRAKDQKEAGNRLESERKALHDENQQLAKNLDTLRDELADEKRQHQAIKQAAAVKERSLQDAREKDARTIEQQIAAAIEDAQNEVKRLEDALEDEKRARAKEKDAQARKDAAEAERKAKQQKEEQQRAEEHSEQLEVLRSEIEQLGNERDQARADHSKKERQIAEQKLAAQKQRNDDLEKQQVELEARLAALEAELDEQRTKNAKDRTEMEAKHKDSTAALNKKLREAWAATEEAEDRAREWDRALKEANDRIEAEAKALDIKYQNLVASHERDQQHAKELQAAHEAAHTAARSGLEKALESEKAQHAITKAALAKAEADGDARANAALREANEEKARAQAHFDAAVRRLEDMLEEERRRRALLQDQKDALQDGFDEMSHEYDTAVTSLELLEAQLQENRVTHEQAMAALTREMERNRAQRSQSVAVADAAEAEVHAVKAELQLCKRKLKRNVCTRCGGTLDTPTFIDNLNEGSVVSVAGSARRTASYGHARGRGGHDGHPSLLSPDRKGMWDSEHDDEAGHDDDKRYGESADF